jgi:hypothetical protein
MSLDTLSIRNCPPCRDCRAHPGSFILGGQDQRGRHLRVWFRTRALAERARERYRTNPDWQPNREDMFGA